MPEAPLTLYVKEFCDAAAEARKEARDLAKLVDGMFDGLEAIEKAAHKATEQQAKQAKKRVDKLTALRSKAEKHHKPLIELMKECENILADAAGGLRDLHQKQVQYLH